MGLVEGLQELQGAAGNLPRNPPLTQTASSHAISIRTETGRKIGRIQSWAPSMTREVETIYEVQRQSTGEPIEKIGQNQTTSTITVTRYELYGSLIGEAFEVPMVSGKDMYTIILQSRPFNVRESWKDPFGMFRAYAYIGCWFSNLGIAIASNDDRIIKANATLEFTRRLKLA